jgi:hypothetical protein
VQAAETKLGELGKALLARAHVDESQTADIALFKELDTLQMFAPVLEPAYDPLAFPEAFAHMENHLERNIITRERAGSYRSSPSARTCSILMKLS